jgi:hypothetical protein
MKLTQNTSPVKISGAVSAPSNFHIAASKEGFRTLSSGLYTNKIRAVIRELSCNAYDAHVAANRADLPFSVHLPMSFEPFFSVKDFGTGLEFESGGCRGSACPVCGDTDEYLPTCFCKGTGNIPCTKSTNCICGGSEDYDAVKVLYCTYFATNKSDSNLFVGALGLGSKSPFSYTEGFSVTNTYQGVTRVYSAYINEKGLPTILLQTETETPDVPNGVEVTFPVKQYDVWEFENQAKYVWEFFDPKPDINVTLLTIESKEYELRMPQWGLRKGGGSPRAVQGMVQYSLGDIDESRLTPDQKRLLKLPLDFFFPIGELSVAASRESLSNDERTIENILRVLDSVKNQLLEETRTQIMNCQSLWEAKLLIYRLQNKDGIGPMISAAFQAGEFADLNPKFKLSDEVPRIDQKDFPGLAIKDFSSNFSSRPLARTAMVTNDKIPPDVSYAVQFSAKKDVLFVINDVGFGTDKFIHWMLQIDEKNEVDTVYFLTKAHKDVTIDTVLNHAAKMILDLGTPPYVLMSELKEKYQEEMKGHNPNVYVPKTVLCFDIYSHIPSFSKGWRASWIDNSKEPLPEGVKYYLSVKAGVPTVGYFHQATSLKEYLKLLYGTPDLGITKDTEVYGIPTWYVDKLDDSWVELTSHVANQVSKLLTKDIQSQLAFHQQGFDSGINDVLVAIHKKNLLPVSSEFKQFVDRWIVAKQYDQTFITNLTELLKRTELQGIYSSAGNVIDFKAEWKNVKQRYPLLGNLKTDYYSHSLDAKEVARYVTLIDNEMEAIDILSLAKQQTQTVEEEMEYAN